ncbi:2349_t:CDS:2 [Dentiscutata erythropus]|uniref:2349_t:CDS:1 n=1 Tax=Dentiscutata erythropus TaxID=1348616 RepID=A0A9N9B5V7_9GLOM|nr:2349_t:CDS:2 [Dentiscutata erythropus]
MDKDNTKLERYKLYSVAFFVFSIIFSYFMILNRRKNLQITIIKKYPSRREEKFLIELSLQDKLIQVRTRLKEIMSLDCYFMTSKDVKALNESELSVSDIIENNVDSHFLHIGQPTEFNYTSLNDEKAFVVSEYEYIKQAIRNAFKIKISKIKLINEEFSKTIESKCRHKCEKECKRKFIFDGRFSVPDATQWFSAIFGFSLDNSRQENSQYTVSTEHKISVFRKAKIILEYKNNECIEPTDDFINDVKTALNDSDPIRELRRVSENYGYFYARILYVGASIDKNIINTEDSSTIHKSGNIAGLFKTGTSNANANIGATHKKEIRTNSSNSNSEITDQSIGTTDPKNWEVIGYDKIYSIFELLSIDLRQMVLEALGKRILDAGVIDIKFFAKKTKEFIPTKYRLSGYIDDTIDISRCQIFTSIMSKNGSNNLFSSYVHYRDFGSEPEVIVHLINRSGNRFNKDYSAQLSWIVVGPLTSFDFSSKHQREREREKKRKRGIEPNSTMQDLLYLFLKLETRRFDISENQNIDEFNNSSFDTQETCVLGICELKSNFNNDTIVYGAHLTSHTRSAHLFAYCLKDNKEREDLLNVIINNVRSSQQYKIGQTYVDLKSNKNFCIANTCQNKKINIEFPILVNQHFTNCDKNCRHKGFICVNSKHEVIHGFLPLNDQTDQLPPCPRKISYFLKEDH